MTKSGEVVELTQKNKDIINKQISELAKKGLRTLAFSLKTNLGDLEGYNG